MTVVDILAPPDVHLCPFLMAAPAITASFAGPRMAALVGAIAVLAQVTVAVTRASLTDLNHTLQILALILISVLAPLVAFRRERRERQLIQLRAVASENHGSLSVHELPLPGVSELGVFRLMACTVDLPYLFGATLLSIAPYFVGSRRRLIGSAVRRTPGCYGRVVGRQAVHGRKRSSCCLTTIAVGQEDGRGQGSGRLRMSWWAQDALCAGGRR
ncbi:hypothetical protein [Streptomyces zaehneri]|uniref:hypothetical protein n=1 Tax=Streptomyces zaehneri TaxID=3051180 RepID=UPI0028D6F9D8|nr:hypothetical protein [Streptomyces sp. DSM 40713]